MSAQWNCYLKSNVYSRDKDLEYRLLIQETPSLRDRTPSHNPVEGHIPAVQFEDLLITIEGNLKAQLRQQHQRG